ncbi:MAG: histidinol dehydrogenase [Spirochaetes bacterium]|nr:histidinol dehydrogenase [Spirochaetota bacterium]
MKFFELKKAEIPNDLAKFLQEEEKSNYKIEKTVQKWINEIKKNGFKAVAKYSKKFDNFNLTETNAAVSEKEIVLLAKKISPELSKSLETAVKRVRDFHEKELQKSFFYIDKEKNKMGQKVIPIDSAAIYIPGGGALYPSTLYMTAIPAIIAGVKRIVLFSPPKTFIESPAVATLVKLLKIKEIYRIGGAQAIITAAYGAGNIKPVDKIVGPGNIYVATAKQLVYGKTDIDMIAGPSEILVIADTDKEEDIPLIAADLLSQAEHPPGGYARAILIGTDKNYLLKIKEELYKQANDLSISENAIKSLNQRGIIINCPNIFTALEISNIIAPEHLELFSYKPYKLLDKVRNAGSVFLGRYTPESVGDYLGGPNHVLPTSRTARFFSPLGVYDFQKRFSWIEFSRDSLDKYTKNITAIANSEGLYAHGKSALIRFNKQK